MAQANVKVMSVGAIAAAWMNARTKVCAVPAGMSTGTVRRARTRPCPWQVTHGVAMTVPYPRQVPQGLDVITLPRSERTERWMLPVPWQMSQGTGAVVSSVSSLVEVSSGAIAGCSVSAAMRPDSSNPPPLGRVDSGR